MAESDAISFRLSPLHRKLLTDRAAAAGLRSRNLLAQQIIVAALETETPDAMITKLAVIERELAETRKDLSVATEAILAHAGQLPETEASSWVRQNLKAR